MRKQKNKKERILDRLLNVPEEVSNRETKITILGFKKMLFENYIAILEYQDFYIRIKKYKQNDIMVLGDIDSLDFEKIED